MKRAFGPIVTTGMALVVAGVIVANPVIAPRADVQIPAVQLSSGSDDTVGMLDEAFLNAIAPAPPDSTNPFAVLKQLISSLAADATYLGKSAIVDAFVAGVTAVSQPELTAAWSPYVAPNPEVSAVTAPLLPVPNIPLPAASATDVPVTLPDPADYLDSAVSPVLRDFVSSIVNDVGYVGGELVSAAFAAGTVVAAEPAMIAATLRALVKGDFVAAINTAVKVVIAPLTPSVIVVDALRTVLEERLAPLLDFAPAPQEPTVDPTQSVAPVVQAPPASSTDLPTRRGRDITPTGEAPAAEILPAPAAAVTTPPPTLEITLPGSGQIRLDARDSAPAPTAPVTRKPAAAARDAVKAIGEQVGAAVNSAADAVGRAAGRAGAGGHGAAAE